MTNQETARHDLLIEIGTEELPPKALPGLSNAFLREVSAGFKAAKLTHGEIRPFASPRRLALLIPELDQQQPDSKIEKLGPALKAAFDTDGNPTKAAEGFARSCGVAVAGLGEKDDGKVTKLYFESNQPGQATATLLENIVKQALAKLPIPRRMRWGANRDEFVRPVHWVVLLFGKEVVPSTILGAETGNQSYGHRFHHPEAITLDNPADYEEKLENVGKVVTSFNKRREIIRQQVQAEADKHQAIVEPDEALLDEVTALVEWPVALTGNFDKAYLDVPQEALISSMREHQKCFHLLDKDGNILPHFITISNLQSKDPAQVVAGNEKVIGPRLADAAFFFEQDKKSSLASRQEKLKSIVFQQELGTLFEKSARVAALAGDIAGALGADTELAKRAAQLGKCDLVTSMVYEFADLQGIMGKYYARLDGEADEVASAMEEQYQPRFAGDQLPSTMTGTVLALAERLDSITGLFSIKQPPTGSKDPFALRRAALGVLRILVEKQLDLDLPAVVSSAANRLPGDFDKPAVSRKVLDFIFDRFRAWYNDQGINTEVFLAVDAVRPASPHDFNLRIQAVSHFLSLPEAESLAAANKRVANILARLEQQPGDSVDSSLLSEPAEQALATALGDKRQTLEQQIQSRDYTQALASLASLQTVIDRFFDEVMVNTEDAAVRANRQALLQQLRQLFLSIADISCLQTAGQ